MGTPPQVTIVASGVPGATGPAGATGATGPAGHTPQLYSGTTVPSGLHTDGDLYLRTTTGDLYQQQAGAWALMGAVQGPAGPTGPTGPSGATGSAGHTPALYSGTSVPSTVQTDGDLYLRTSTGDLYAQQAGAWALAGNLLGPTGAAGATGATGAAGHTPQLFSGTSVPSTLQANGDLYLRTSTGDLYQQQSGAWVLEGNLQAGTVLQSTATAKGDLLAATGAGTVTRLPVGTDGQLLVADSTATPGVSWKPTAYAPSWRLPRYVQPSVILTEFQSGHGFTSSGATFTANDATDFVRGVQAAKLTTPGDSVTYYVTGTVTASDSTGKMPRITVKVDDITKMSNLQIDLCTDTSWSNGWSWNPQTSVIGSNYFTSGDWVTQTLSFHDAAKIGAGARTGLAAIRFRIADNGASTSVHLQGVELVPDGTQTFPNGVVSITFDDSWQDALDLGKTALDKYNYPATTFVIADRIGLSGRLTLAELQNLQTENGWELASHAFLDSVHTSTFTGVTAATLEADARAMKAYAIQNGFRAADLIAYPKGQYGLTSDGVSTTSILDKYFAAGITTIQKTKETYPPSEAWRLRRISSITTFAGGYNPTLLTQAGGDFDQCKANGSWLILAFHEIVNGAPTTASQIAQSDFQTVIDSINAHGIPVMTVGEVLRYAATTTTASAILDSTASDFKAPAPTAAAGTTGKAADAGHVHPTTGLLTGNQLSPADHGLIAWNLPPYNIRASDKTALTAGTLYVAKVPVPYATTISKIGFSVVQTAATLTSGQNFGALYGPTGNLLASTADLTSQFGTTGSYLVPLASSQAVAAGYVYVAYYWQGTTPGLALAIGDASSALLNYNLPNAGSLWASANTGLTTAMPSTLAALTSTSIGIWACVA